jgi:hypothetical protein
MPTDEANNAISVKFHGATVKYQNDVVKRVLNP